MDQGALARARRTGKPNNVRSARRTWEGGDRVERCWVLTLDLGGETSQRPLVAGQRPVDETHGYSGSFARTGAFSLM